MKLRASPEAFLFFFQALSRTWFCAQGTFFPAHPFFLRCASDEIFVGIRLKSDAHPIKFPAHRMGKQ